MLRMVSSLTQSDLISASVTICSGKILHSVMSWFFLADSSVLYHQVQFDGSDISIDGFCGRSCSLGCVETIFDPVVPVLKRSPG